MTAKCWRYSRIIKSQPWAEMGIGPICASRMGISAPDESTAKTSGKGQARSPKPAKLRKPFDIRLKRDEQGYANANVLHGIVRHSPTGFEWGYGGSGPADLALNILTAIIGQQEAEQGGLYQKFKDDFIAAMPFEGGTIKAADIDVWIKENRKDIHHDEL